MSLDHTIPQRAPFGRGKDILSTFPHLLEHRDRFSWQPNNDGTGRLHAAVIKAINIVPQGKGQYFMEIETVYRTGAKAFAFPEQHAEAANYIKQLVEQAKASLPQ